MGAILFQVTGKSKPPGGEDHPSGSQQVHVDELIRSGMSGALVLVALTVGTLPIPH